MTVADLIAKLHQFPAETVVLVTGFDEWGFDGLGDFQIVEVAPVAPRSHGPRYELAENVNGSEDGPSYKRSKSTGPVITALHLGR